ncbi:hypothetical protein [Thermoflavimicrobium daqui]|uniref:ABC-2 transporter permease n=1 Tax=Thermoflavimicrobium daqui TaxID=2137476 RepID=A0A364K333_9BACL|nr:hypothetical protein [Thermoflavimicrobium daqui]RAL23247.1 hypothetical protein DL897_12860 [Thermoflavimicrobium daqui]
MWRDMISLTKQSIRSSMHIFLINLLSVFICLPIMLLNTKDNNLLLEISRNYLFSYLLILPAMIKSEHFSFQSFYRDQIRQEITFLRSFPISTHSILISRLLHILIMALFIYCFIFMILFFSIPVLFKIEITAGETFSLILSFFGLFLFLLIPYLYIELIQPGHRYFWISGAYFLVIMVVFITIERVYHLPLILLLVKMVKSNGNLSSLLFFIVGLITSLVSAKGLIQKVAHGIR